MDTSRDEARGMLANTCDKAAECGGRVELEWRESGVGTWAPEIGIRVWDKDNYTRQDDLRWEQYR